MFKNVKVINQVLYICYQMQFQKDKNKNILALINSASEINIMILTYTVKLGLKVERINATTSKIVSSSLKTYSIVIGVF